MIESLTKIYEGADLSGATNGVIYIPIFHAVNLNRLDVKGDENVAGADAVFSITRNGAEIAEATVPVGTNIVGVENLDLDLERGDAIVLNLVSGAIAAPVTLNLDVDDGLTGGASAYGVDSAPASPNAIDEEFDTALKSGWSKVVTGTLTESLNGRARSWYLADLSSADASLTLTKEMIEAGDFSITACAIGDNNQNFHGIGVLIGDAENQNHYESNLVYNATQYIETNAKVAGTMIYALQSANLAVNTNELAKVYLHIERKGNLWTTAFSPNGIGWKKTVIDYSHTFDVEKLVLQVFSASATNKFRAGYNWVRKNWLFL